MHISSFRDSLLAAICAFGCSWVGGCRTAPQQPEKSTGSFTLAPPALIIPEIKPAPMKRPASFDLGALDLEEFIPPGAELIGPYGQIDGTLVEEIRTRHPTAEPSPSPDGEAEIFNDGYKATRSIVHWLNLRRRSSRVTNAILSTTASYDTMWSPKSDAFAVTHYVGGNTTEVFIVSLANLERVEVPLKPIVAAYFPPRFASLPMFAKAYRWSSTGDLIVRGIAQTSEKPFERIGCELKVSLNPGESPVTFLRGYIQALAN